MPLFYVYSTDALSSAGCAIDQQLAPVISMSYGFCELAISSSADDAQQLETAVQIANASGITWVASSGDAAAASCEHNAVKTAIFCGVPSSGRRHRPAQVDLGWISEKGR